MNIIEKMKEDWDRRAHYHARFWVDTGHYENDEIFDNSGSVAVDSFLGLLDSYDTSMWDALEIGCGIGRLTKLTSRYFRILTGVDVSDEMIRIGRDRLKGIDNVELFKNSGIDLKQFDSSRFDFVYSCITFQHIPREVFNAYLDEINRVIKPAGFFEFQIYAGNSRDAAFEDTLTVRVYEEGELFDQLTRHGFTLVNKKTESTDRQGIESLILLTQKTGDIQSSTFHPLEDRECESVESDLEKQLNLQLAKDFVSKGNGAEAEHLLKLLVKNNSNFLEAWLELAILLLESGKGETAILFAKYQDIDDPSLRVKKFKTSITL